MSTIDGPNPHGRPPAFARHAHDPAEGLHQRVVARSSGERPAPPERADVAVDERRLLEAERLCAESE
jgi:hypothetical protein